MPVAGNQWVGSDDGRPLPGWSRCDRARGGRAIVGLGAGLGCLGADRAVNTLFLYSGYCIGAYLGAGWTKGTKRDFPLLAQGVFRLAECRFLIPRSAPGRFDEVPGLC